jgi:hypothetical protein
MKTVLIACLLLSNVVSAYASKPDTRAGKDDEAKDVCFDALKTHALDPTSIEIHTDSVRTYRGQGLVNKHIIWVSVGARSKNIFGAMLEHQYFCGVKCLKDQTCKIDTIDEDSDPR